MGVEQRDPLQTPGVIPSMKTAFRTEGHSSELDPHPVTVFSSEPNETPDIRPAIYCGKLGSHFKW